MPYCSSEHRIQGYDEHTVEIDSEDITENQLTVDLTLTRPCAGCGSDVATGNLTIEIDHEHEGEEPEFELDGDLTAEPVDEYTGKGRGQKHFLGATVSGVVTCSVCKENIDVEGEDKLQASEFEVETSH